MHTEGSFPPAGFRSSTFGFSRGRGTRDRERPGDASTSADAELPEEVTFNMWADGLAKLHGFGEPLPADECRPDSRLTALRASVTSEEAAALELELDKALFDALASFEDHRRTEASRAFHAVVAAGLALAAACCVVLAASVATVRLNEVVSGIMGASAAGGLATSVVVLSTCPLEEVDLDVLFGMRPRLRLTLASVLAIISAINGASVFPHIHGLNVCCAAAFACGSTFFSSFAGCISFPSEAGFPTFLLALWLAMENAAMCAALLCAGVGLGKAASWKLNLPPYALLANGFVVLHGVPLHCRYIRMLWRSRHRIGASPAETPTAHCYKVQTKDIFRGCVMDRLPQRKILALF